MRAALVLAALCLAGSALAQESQGSFNVQTLNGVRVWRPKPATVSAAPQPEAPQAVTVVVNPAPVVARDDDDGWGDNGFWGVPISPFFHGRRFVHGGRPFHSRPFFHGSQVGFRGRF
jgi:hypothetical protein